MVGRRWTRWHQEATLVWDGGLGTGRSVRGSPRSRRYSGDPAVGDNASLSSLRDEMPNLLNTFRRCHSTVRALRNRLRRDLEVGAPVSCEPGDVRLLRSEIVAGTDVALADLLARRDQLPTRPFRERLGAHHDEHLVCGAQLTASIDSPVLPSQPLAVQKVRSGEFSSELRATQPLQRIQVIRLGILAFADQGQRPCLEPRCPVRAGDRYRRQSPHCVACEFRLAASDRGLDQLRERPPA